jgi:hypothetical protein
MKKLGADRVETRPALASGGSWTRLAFGALIGRSGARLRDAAEDGPAARPIAADVRRCLGGVVPTILLAHVPSRNDSTRAGWLEQ